MPVRKGITCSTRYTVNLIDPADGQTSAGGLRLVRLQGQRRQQQLQCAAGVGAPPVHARHAVPDELYVVARHHRCFDRRGESRRIPEHGLPRLRPQQQQHRRAAQHDRERRIRAALRRGKAFCTAASGSRLLGGWELAGIAGARTGLPVNITMTRKASALPDGNTSSQRPNLVPGVPIYAANQTIDNWFNPAAFAAPANGTWGNLRTLNRQRPGHVRDR